MEEGKGRKKERRRKEEVSSTFAFPFSKRKKHSLLLTWKQFDVWLLSKDILGSISVYKCVELKELVLLIHVVYINAIHDVYPNSLQEAATPDGPHVHVLLKYIQKKNSSIVA